MLFVFLGTLFVFLMIGVPIAFSLLLAAVGLMFAMDIFDSQIIAQNLVTGANNFPLMAIPFFMLAGELMNAGGISKRIVNFSMALVGHIRGGLGYVVIVAGVMFAGLSGSAVADTAALGAILIPMMLSKGYDKNSATGLVAASGVIAPIIPPSIPMILFGVVGGVSVTQLFMAGIIPGLMLGIGLMITWTIVARKKDYPKSERASTRQVLIAFKDAIWAMFLPVIIVGGLRFGVFTPTEAAVIAAVYALFVGMVIYRELKFHQLVEVFVAAAKTTSVVMLVAASAMASAWLITVAQLPAELASLLSSFTTNPTAVLLIIMVFLLLIGMVMDMTPAILIFTPVLLPMVVDLGINPVVFGILMVLNLTIGLITPPVGTVLYVGAGISKISIVDITKGIWPFLLVEIAVLFLLVFFPQLITVPLQWFL